MHISIYFTNTFSFWIASNVVKLSKRDSQCYNIHKDIKIAKNGNGLISKSKKKSEIRIKYSKVDPQNRS